MNHCKKHASIKTYFLALLAGLIIYSCATPVAPTGGLKDEIPPVVLGYSPDNYSTSFEGNTFSVTFDEYVQLKDITQKLLISPPMDDAPKVKLKGKTMLVDILDTLQPNTTYSFYFANAIVDLHESNPLENFIYVFTTGEVLDSMQISGKLIDAYTLQPVSDAYVMLYNDMEDSIPIKEIPFYLSKTGKNGAFSLSNLAAQSYKLFALKDNNNNYLFDLPNERIAFVDTLITPTEVTVQNRFMFVDTTLFPHPDSIPLHDSIHHDTLHFHADHVHDSLFLRLFTERDTALKITSSTMEENMYISIGFNMSIDTLQIEVLKPEMPEAWYTPDWFGMHDSLLLWIKDFEQDSLVLELKANNTLQDTLIFTYFKSEKDLMDSLPPELELKPLLKGSKLKLEHPLELESNTPLTEVLTTDSLTLFSSIDTLQVPIEKSAIRNLTINHKWRENEQYQLLLPDSAFFNMYGAGNDSTMIRFSTREYKNYGTLLLQIQFDSTIANTYPYQIQMLSENEKDVFQEFTVTQDTLIKLRLQDPGKYIFKGFEDRNGNKKWDSGLYLKHEQPERIIYMPDRVEIIANWDVEYTWKIEKP